MTTGTPQPFDPRRSPGGGTPPSRRRRPVLLPLTIAGWALLEIWLLTVLGDAAGGLTVFLVLLAGFVLGAAAIKRAGRRAWRRLAETMQAPDGSVMERSKGGGNALAMLGGLLLMIPGPLSDVVGLACLFPPTAALLRRATGRLLSSGSGPLGTAYQEARVAQEQVRIHRPDGKVVPGEVIREEEEGGPDAPEEKLRP
ncbi:FxsA family protein [Streptomyces sp. ACA25]|uniref:FxsA family membrane protein n=1 Tax=Streptomyces sp. ACA25 TaxID=3022596 RepID=UPI00230737F5|nr:FxsA family membrane protein [Streptomyces sp. ACA25]MDB1088867.1 FxsA family protein [Streptomyces sp. ACA25]